MNSQIKTIYGEVLYESENKNNTIKQTVIKYIDKEMKKGKHFADLRNANLSYYDLSFINFSFCDLTNATFCCSDLSFASFICANLSSATVNSANFSYANLHKANLNGVSLGCAILRSTELDKRFIQISCIGSRKGLTTYCFDDDIIWCGCFEGNLEKFEARVKKIHKNNEQYLKEYLGFINYLKSLK
jgi:hypothetical protein